MDYTILTVAAITSVAGIAGSAAGGILSILVDYRRGRTLSNIMQFAAGVMLSVVAFDLLPTAFARMTPAGTIIAATAGAIAMMLISAAFSEDEAADLQSMSRRLKTLGINTVIGMAVHNFVEGLAVGSGFGVSTSLGFSLTVAIFLHDIPEGIAMASPLLGSGMKQSRSILIVAATGIPMVIGALAGILLGGISQGVISACLAAAGGTMLFMSLGDILPSAHRLYDGKGVASVVGMLVGALFVLFI